MNKHFQIFSKKRIFFFFLFIVTGNKAHLDSTSVKLRNYKYWKNYSKLITIQQIEYNRKNVPLLIDFPICLLFSANLLLFSRLIYIGNPILYLFQPKIIFYKQIFQFGLHENLPVIERLFTIQNCLQVRIIFYFN